MNGVENNREMRNMNYNMDEVNAALTAIASAEPPVYKRRWISFLRRYWCFGCQKSSRQFGHAVLVPYPTPSVNGTATVLLENATQQPSTGIPLVAPPASPASFLSSDQPSISQSPAASGDNSLFPNMYSPVRPRSIFDIGPYAYETQLVTPPVFSTNTTQPSTAPFTPPPESVHLTNPPSPELPFAQLSDPIFESPDSEFFGSGTSSPLVNPSFPGIQCRVPQKPLSLEVGPMREWDSQQASGSVTPDAVHPKSGNQHVLVDREDYLVSLFPNVPNSRKNDDLLIDHRVSFELTSKDGVTCVEKNPTALSKAIQNADERDHNTNELVDDKADTGSAASLRLSNEFNFGHVNRLDSDKSFISANWWADEKVIWNRGRNQ